MNCFHLLFMLIILQVQLIIFLVRLPITATTITKRNTVKKKILINKKRFYNLLTQKKSLFTHTKQTYGKQTQQILTANGYSKFPRQITAKNSHRKQLRQILKVKCYGFISGQRNIANICEGVPILLTHIIARSFMFYI